ncbi:MAG: hypothetical protein WBA19_10110 [Psychroserpens sp.]
MHRLTIFKNITARLCVAVVCLFMANTNAFAQDDEFVILRKNYNPLAYDLDHNLSHTQDSLLLKNKTLFTKVRFINEENELIFDFNPAVKEAKIPLHELPLGKYTVMFYQKHKIIVFQVDKLKPFNLDASNFVDSDLASADFDDLILVNDVPKSFRAINNKNADGGISRTARHASDKNYIAFQEKMIVPYDLTEKDRSIVQTRAEYRNTHLRPNGKPYN